MTEGVQESRHRAARLHLLSRVLAAVLSAVKLTIDRPDYES